jgi:hypothetical protein
MLTKEELSLLKNAEILLLKNTALARIQDCLTRFQHALDTYSKGINDLSNLLPESSTTKLSKGENYKGLPYVVLDYRAHYTKTNIFAFRTLFWWGYFFSFSLHLQGTFLENFRTNLLANSAKLTASDFYICIYETPWQYDFTDKNYVKISELNNIELTALLSSKSFIKIAHKINLDEFNKLDEIGVSTFEKMLKLIG